VTPPQHQADVVIYGSTPAGMIAAVAAARDGRSVTIVTPGPSSGRRHRSARAGFAVG